LVGIVVSVQLFYLAGVVSDPYVQGYLVRMKPILFWGMGLCFQTLLTLPLFRYGFPNLGNKLQRNIICNSGYILIVLLLLGVLIAVTGIGIKPDKVGWDTPGVPILPIQIGLIWGLGVMFLSFDSWLGRKKVIARYKYLIDFLTSILLWGLAFALWSQAPLTPDYFAPEPRAPNYEYYPYSDAALHDVIAQDLLIGEGFSGIARKPLYALFLAFLHVLKGQNYMDVVIIQVAVLAVFPVLIYWLAKGLHHRISGFIAAGLIILRERNAITLSGEIRVSHSKLMMSDLPAAVAMVIITWLLVLWLQAPARRRLLPVGIGGRLVLVGVLDYFYC
jgi:hypothetical protein